MRTISVVPSQVAMNVIERAEQPVGCLTLVGSGETADVIIEVVFDAAGLAALEAATGEARVELRAATTRR